MRQVDDFYICPICQEPLNYNPGSDPCAKCEWWIDEERKEEDRYNRMLRERDEWIRENEWKRW